MINSVNNAVKIIDCFTTENPELGVSEISTKLNMNKSTVHHLIRTLNKVGILVKASNRKYRLGSRLLRWGNLVSKYYQKYYPAIPYLNELVKLTGETVHMAVQENQWVSYIAKVEPEKSVKIQTAIGSYKPIHCTGLGKMLLAGSLGRDNHHIYQLILDKYTDSTITEHEKLIRELKQIHEQGYAIDNEEYEVGLYCISAPIKDSLGQTVAAISIAGPECRVYANKDQYIAYLISTAETISNKCDL
ncbi:IclR family transcriptional regulator [Bacillus tuaregi]|uniref:IclR family transcriptional regulator n=1 Tax=Bacillus tuaregi TaxID=1816695 RepID=UPI0008F88441|nr:IclR family transcriptional regulator [Bacillus tuaregi]